MSFRASLWSYIKTDIEPSLPASIYYGAQSPDDDSPFYSMQLVSDPEQPAVVCERQGDAGTALIQFQYSVGNTASNASLGVAEDALETLKNLVRDIRGSIGGGYRVWGNDTNGVASIGDPATQWWGVLFESTLSWNKE